jgi:quercetin dioxygenase-like cupin family protein
MIIHDVASQLKEAGSPVIKVLQNQASGKVLVIGLKKGVSLKKHQTAIPARLAVIEGKVAYQQNDISVTLNKFDDIAIPVNRLHAVEALEDSICLLIIG